MTGRKPTTIDNRSQLVYALTEVAQLEHVLMCQYLFAAFSMKSQLTEFTNASRCYHQLELVRKWKRQLLNVAREEMQHLAYAVNLLVSVGGAPTFTRPNFPSTNRFFRAGPGDPGVEMSLERFDPEAKTIRRFVRFETDDPQADRERVELLEAVPDPNYYETLPDFYRAVKAGFTKEMFVPLGPQYDPVDEGGESIRLRRSRNVPNVVTSVEEARSLIDLVVIHGEGSTSSDPEAHLHIFREILKELQAEVAIDPKFAPARNVVPNPLSRLHDNIHDAQATYTVVPKDRDGGLQHNLLQLFNGAYEVLLGWLYQLFARHGSPDELRAIETLAFLPYMSEVIRPLGEVLTLVPAELGTIPTLGASFEVTSNNFLVPSAAVTTQLTSEKLDELVYRADAAAKALAKQKLAAAATEFEPIRRTLRSLRDEFASRVAKGWPPRPTQNPKAPEYSEDNKYSEAAKRMWIGCGPPVLELEFQGWAQIRLATDPDCAEVRRGCTGNAFAIGDEPDLDRVIRLQPAGSIVRSHCPAVGVKVFAARILTSPLQPAGAGQVVSQFVGATVDLLGSPKFEGRNHLVSEDGEPIDPFELEVIGPAGIVLRRRAIGIPLNDMTPVQRRGSGRYPANLQVSIAAMRENMRRAGLNSSPDEYVAKRIQLLEAELAKVPAGEEAGRVAEELRFRIAVLNGAKPGNIRWTRFFFDAEYLHTISGEMTADVPGVEPKFVIRQPSKDEPANWLVNYHFGLFDTDALSAYVFGTLRVPIDRPLIS